METKLGKITETKFGMLNDREFMFGLELRFEGEGWGVTSTSLMLNIGKECKWSDKERLEAIKTMNERIHELLLEAKVHHVGELLNIPVEITFKDNMIKDFRILTEVL